MFIGFRVWVVRVEGPTSQRMLKVWPEGIETALGVWASGLVHGGG